MKFLSSLIILILCASFAFSQSGIIRGTVTEASTGEPLFGVNVVIAGTSTGAVTDFDGKFEIKAQPGSYSVQVSFVTYSTITIEGVEVKAGDVTVLNNIAMSEDIEQLGEVVVTAKALRTTEQALLTLKRKSANLMDGISSANFKKIGDSDAADAVKRVTGVSVEGGKYVYVRGLGDRYSKTMLNSMDVPGLDPDRNSIQIDIFPTNLIDNMIVLKTAVAEMPADFTGGVVNIETKDFPEEQIMDVSFNMTYNPSMHFNNNFLVSDESSTDWLGYDSEVRTLPNGARNPPTPGGGTDAQEVFDFNNSFNPIMGAGNQNSLLDYGLSFTNGNQKAFNNGNKFGYILSGTYKSTKTHYDDLIFGEYQLADNSEDKELISATVQTGTQSNRNVLVGGLGGLAFKTNNSKFRLTAMRLQSGESRAAQFNIVADPDGRAAGKSSFEATSDNLEYTESSLTNLLLGGEHFVGQNNWVIDWKLSSTLSNLTDPDIRKAAFSESLDGQERPIISSGEAGLPTRIWRYLDEVNYSGKVDITKNTKLFDNDAKFKAGTSYLFKERDYEILEYQLQFQGRQPEWSGNPNGILDDENLFPNAGGGNFRIQNADPNPNAYNSTVNNANAYISGELSPISSLKAVLGVRAEYYLQRHTGRDIQFAQSGFGNNLEDEVVLDELNFFPSANLIYNLTDQQNLRGSYSRTIARPSFKELSFAQIIDPISNRIFNGALFPYNDPVSGDQVWDGNLVSTLINNYDLRWELFLKNGQLFSASLFYKTFENPIELVRIRQAITSNEFQPRNVGDAEVYGAEIEFRKSLNFISPQLSNFSLNGNFTFTESVLTMSDVEFEARKAFEKEGENITNSRPMAGQAPYVINGGIGYENIDAAFDAGIFYNVKGPTLIVVGGGLFPDVFSEPFHSLNFNLNKRFGAEDQFSLNVSVSNILNDVREEFYVGFEAQDQYFTRRAPGTSFSVGFGYSF